MAAPNRPGKTAPRFILDLLAYDPSNPPRSHFNLLTDPLPVFHDYSSFPQIVSRRSCEHRYIIKPDYSRLPPEDVALPPSEVCRVSAVCLDCRCHLELGLSYGSHKKGGRGHIHHLVYSPQLPKLETPRNPFAAKGQQLEFYHFQCSDPSCSAIALAKFLSPLLTPHFVDLLTNELLLKKRTGEALEAEPERLEGLGRPLPITVLSNLRRYIENSLHHPERSKPITSNNKRFMTCFGVGGRPCRELLDFLEFTPNDDNTSWTPPQPDSTTIAPYQKEVLTVFLDNASHELLCLMNQRSQHEKARHSEELVFQAANSSFYQLMGALKYDRAQHMPRTLSVPETPPYYEALGAVDDMSNNLVVEAYNRQIAADPVRMAYYLRCLQSIGLWRGDPGGLSIAQAVSYEYSIGRYADNDVPEAFSYFQLDYRNENLTEDAIIGSFFARLGDSADDMEPRRQLWRIGDSLRSEKIKAVAEERVSTVEQALVFLGAEKDTPDDFIISTYAAKVSDTPASKDLAKHAVELVANARQSKALFHFLQTGEMEAREMDIGEAFQLLQIPDRTADDTAILAAFSVCCSDAPAQVETFRKALSIIAKEKQSAVLSNVLADGPNIPAHALMDWPVGLNNIGNTCYLNSLLQFYFTITPFRNMVLYVEDYKAGLDEESIQNKRVGSRKVSPTEIERSQKFLKELRLLFQSMITSPYPAVTPGQELARLTLLSSTGEAAIRRKSMANATLPNLGEINGLPVQGPLGPPTAEAGDDIQPSTEGPPPRGPETGDTDSQRTFVSAPTPPSSDQDTQMVGTEGAFQQDSEKTGDSEMMETEYEHQSYPNVPTPPTEPATEAPSPPDRPPPVPPRPEKQADKEQLIKEEVELGAQQDVTEVINNVLFQAQCAIKPLRYDADGDPVDLVTDLFYGKTKSYITAEKGTRSKDELWADIKVDVATGSRDVYAAIDGAFDVQRVHVDGADAEQHGAISKLPPVLQIQVQRVQFDQVKKTSFKSTHHLQLKETIYLDRYMDAPVTDGPDDLHRRRREKWQWKDELRALEARRAEFVDSETWELLPDAFRKTREKLQGLKSMEDTEELGGGAFGVDDSVISDLEDLEYMTQNEIRSIEARERELHTLIETQFADLHKIPYHLYAVFMHHGSVSFGHYYIYIYDFAKGIWRKYNDNYVTEVHDTAEIFGGENLQNPPTPYFVVYVHDRMRERVAQPVCRNVVDEPEQAPAPRSQSPSRPTRPTTAPTPPPRPPAHRAGEDVEMAEISRAGGNESRMSSPGMHNHVDVVGNKRFGAGDISGATAAKSSSSQDAHWNTDFADRADVEW